LTILFLILTGRSEDAITIVPPALNPTSPTRTSPSTSTAAYTFSSYAMCGLSLSLTRHPAPCPGDNMCIDDPHCSGCEMAVAAHMSICTSLLGRSRRFLELAFHNDLKIGSDEISHRMCNSGLRQARTDIYLRHTPQLEMQSHVNAIASKLDIVVI
jgi:hypothetical protein